ncbi:hypothetical protein DFJ63DRAFT_311881 [Scheffersomyces coipomensis]|uniref:uncharacterized protein n=1 Tax=Scheffersomyces coipomensis TaxID=1788519 RepID=UPI00315D8DB9
MISRHICSAARISRRTYSSNPLSFIPNEDRHIFDGEKLTAEQNEAAIPDRPIFEDVERINFNIANPEEIADIISYPDENDFLITVLAKEGSFLGNPNKKFVVKDSTQGSVDLKFRFANIASSWIEVFNNTIIPLTDLPESSSLQSFGKRDTFTNIAAKKENFVKIYPDLYTESKLREFFKYLRAFENSEKTLQGLFSPAELLNTITFEDTCVYLLHEEEVLNNDEKFSIVLKFFEDHSEFSSISNFKSILSYLVNYFDKSDIIEKQNQISAFASFLRATFPNFDVIKDLDVVVLDKLALILSRANELQYANQILSVIVQSKQCCPSQDTLDSYLSSYERSIPQDKEQFLKDITSLKPAFFHKSLSDISFKVLLNNAVGDAKDLHQFLNLVDNAENASTLYSKCHYDLFSKLKSIHVNSEHTSNIIKGLNYSLLFKRLQEKESVNIDDQTKILLSNEYKILGMDENANALDII